MKTCAHINVKYLPPIGKFCDTREKKGYLIGISIIVQ